MTRRLGKGLADIIAVAPQSATNFVMLPVGQIRPGRFQPRASINEPALEELKTSIKRSGVVEPIIVRPIGHGTYELVAGERRFRATQALGIEEIPAIVKTLSDQETLEISLVENVQRENLNPVDEATGYARLLDEFGYTQEDIASAVGKDRTTIANLVRLLTLPEEIRGHIRNGTISFGHAKVLLSIEDHAKQHAAFLQITQERLSVREAETLAEQAAPRRHRRIRNSDPQTQAIEQQLRQFFGTKVRVNPRKRGGRIVIEYFSSEELSRILQVAGVSI